MRNLALVVALFLVGCTDLGPGPDLNLSAQAVSNIAAQSAINAAVALGADEQDLRIQCGGWTECCVWWDDRSTICCTSHGECAANGGFLVSDEDRPDTQALEKQDEDTKYLDLTNFSPSLRPADPGEWAFDPESEADDLGEVNAKQLEEILIDYGSDAASAHDAVDEVFGYRNTMWMRCGSRGMGGYTPEAGCCITLNEGSIGTPMQICFVVSLRNNSSHSYVERGRWRCTPFSGC